MENIYTYFSIPIFPYDFAKNPLYPTIFFVIRSNVVIKVKKVNKIKYLKTPNRSIGIYSSDFNDNRTPTYIPNAITIATYAFIDHT